MRRYSSAIRCLRSPAERSIARDGVIGGPGPDPPREPARQPHQVSVVQHRIRLGLAAPDQAPPPGPEPARRVPHRVVGIEHDPVHAVIPAGQQIPIPRSEVISHPPTVGSRGISRQPDCPEGAIPSGRSPGRNVEAYLSDRLSYRRRERSSAASASSRASGIFSSGGLDDSGNGWPGWGSSVYRGTR